MEDAGGEVEIIEEEEAGDDILDMPTPWSPKLYLKKDVAEEAPQATQKTIFYLKSKVDLYPPYSQASLKLLIL